MGTSPRSDRRAGRVERGGPVSPEPRAHQRNNANDFSRQLVRGSRLSARRLRELAADLSERDRAVLDALGTVRVLSGGQLERLLFAEIAGSARGRIRRRVLGRLVSLGLVQTLERRVGGVRAGSAGLVYALSAGGQRLRDLETSGHGRRRPAYTPGALFLAHALAVSEVFVQLHETLRGASGHRLERFAVETAARFEVGGELTLRPDALVMLAGPGVEDVWWLEIDRGTESLPRLSAMAKHYLAFAGSGVAGPGGVVPRVLVSVTSEPRLHAVRGLVRRLPPPAEALFVVTPEAEVAARLVGELLGEIREPP
jgi:hypothetical protein